MFEEAPVLSPAEARSAYIAAHRRLLGPERRAAAPLPVFLAPREPDKPKVKRRSPSLARFSKLDTLAVIVAGHYGVTLPDLVGRSHSPQARKARGVAMLLARQELWYTLDRVGKFFDGRRPISVRSTVLTVMRRSVADPDLALEISELARRLP